MDRKVGGGATYWNGIECVEQSIVENQKVGQRLGEAWFHN